MLNNPIYYIDPDGKRTRPPGGWSLLRSNDAKSKEISAQVQTMNWKLGIRSLAYWGSVGAMTNPWTFKFGLTSLGLLLGNDILKISNSENRIPAESTLGVLSVAIAKAMEEDPEVAAAIGSIVEALATGNIKNSGELLDLLSTVSNAATIIDKLNDILEQNNSNNNEINSNRDNDVNLPNAPNNLDKEEDEKDDEDR